MHAPPRRAQFDEIEEAEPYHDPEEICDGYHFVNQKKKLCDAGLEAGMLGVLHENPWVDGLQVFLNPLMNSNILLRAVAYAGEHGGLADTTLV